MQESSYGCSVKGMTIHQSRQLPNVYADYASRAVPRTFADVIDWSEHVMTLTDELGDGLKKLYSYFLTPIQLSVGTPDRIEADIKHEIRIKVGLIQTLDYYGHAAQVGLNVATYGNDFVTASLGHTRQIICPKCRRSVCLKDTEICEKMKIQFNGSDFTAQCLNRQCSSRGRRIQMPHHDVVQKSLQNVIIKHWPIRELEFDYCEARDSLQVYWRIPARIKNLINKNDLATLHDYDMSILRAAKENKLFMFSDQVLFHAKHAMLSGLLLQGLGLPRTLQHARPHWLLQLLNKQCQVLASGYLNPIPYFSHAGGQSVAGDPIHGTDHMRVGSMVEQMVSDHRQDPHRIAYMPYDLKFNYAAGAAEQFVPVQLLQFATDKLSTGLVPMGILKGDVAHQAAPFFLRMFESLNRDIPSLYNRFLWWLVERVTSMCGLESVNLVHIPASVVDNVSIDQMLFQGAMSGKISDSAWLERVHLTVQHENARRLVEMKSQMDMQKEVEDYQSQIGITGQVSMLAGQTVMSALQPPQDPAAGSAQDPAQAGMMMPGQLLLPSQGYQPPQNITEMESQAVQLAQMMGQMPPPDRQRELAALRNSSQAMHSMVTAELRKLRQQTAMQARSQMAPNL
jgi:hypothetical protein